LRAQDDGWFKALKLGYGPHLVPQLVPMMMRGSVNREKVR
jgi:hypothetical protein